MKRTDSFLHSLTTLVSGTVVSQLIGVLSIPVIAWFYSPEAFGRFTAIWVLGSTAGALFPLRYERLIAITKLDCVARHISLVAYSLATTFLLVTVLILAFLGYSGVSFLAGVSTFEIISLVCLILLFSVFQIRSQWLIRERKFKRLAVSEVCGLFATLFLQIVFGFYSWIDTESLLLSAVVGRFVQVAASLSKSEATKNPLQVGKAIVLAKKYRVYPTVSTPYSLVSVSASRALIIIAAVHLSAEIVGYLSLAYRLTYLPVSTVANAIRRVYITRLSTQLGVAGFNEFTLSLVKIVTLLLIPYFMFLGVFVPQFISAYLPEQWHGSIQFILVLLPGAGAMLVTAWFDRVYEVLGRQKTAFYMELASSIIIIIIYWLLLANSWSATVSVSVYSVLIAAYNVLWLLVSWRIAGFPIIRFIRELMSILFCLFAIVILWSWVRWTGEVNYLLPITISILISGYAGLLLFKNAKELRYV